MARTLLPLLLCGAALAACEGRSDKTAAEAPKAAAPPPAMATSLWRVDVGGSEAARGSALICADEATRVGFSRPSPEINGKPCPRKGEPVDRPDGYSARCELDGRIYKVGARVTGDTSSDFTVEMSVQPEGQDDIAYTQTRRYVREGACPEGWKLGESRPLPVPAS